MITALEVLTELHKTCCFQTREGKKVGKASNSELRRWIKNGAVIVNGKKAIFGDPIQYPITSFLLFPNKPITLF